MLKEIKIKYLPKDSREIVVFTIFESELDLGNAEKIKKLINSEIENGKYKIIIILENVTLIDSTMLGKIIGLYKKIREKDENGFIRIVIDSSDKIKAQIKKKVFEHTGLHNIFRLYDNLEEAFADLLLPTKT